MISRRGLPCCLLLAAVFTGLPACGGPTPATADLATVDLAAAVDLTAPRDLATCSLIRPYSSKNPRCNACAQRACCGEINRCLAAPDCDDGYVLCLLACALGPADGGVKDCLAACAKSHPQGKLDYDAAIACVDRGCRADCV